LSDRVEYRGASPFWSLFLRRYFRGLALETFGRAGRRGDHLPQS
jgi:hypothetical protein